jgi:Domain of unknown function (DUF4157)
MRATALDWQTGSRHMAKSTTPIQRTCECGNHITPGAGTCERCRRGHAAVHGVVSPGRQLAPATRAYMEKRIRTGSASPTFASVRVHDGPEATKSAKALDARAYTAGHHIVFGAGEFAPERAEGRRLLAHELAHVVQQDGAKSTAEKIFAAEGHLEREAEAVASAIDSPQPVQVTARAAEGVQRQRIGTAAKHPGGVPSPFKTVEATFDGATFVLKGDGKAILSVAAQSGRPISVRAADAKACGGSTAESYLNNPRYVGIKDNGPIPEGEYQFRYEQIATFSAAEQLQMTLGGHYTDPFGTSLHGGDWGSGRVALRPVKILPGKKGCGDTKTRSGFFLHGGVLPGSSGCIDIGNTGMDDLVRSLAGFRGRITVKVLYTQPAPTVSAGQRALGRFTYPGGDDPTLMDRLKAALGGD